MRELGPRLRLDQALRTLHLYRVLHRFPSFVPLGVYGTRIRKEHYPSRQAFHVTLAPVRAFGGARYIVTGRGFATTRTPFALLYSRFALSRHENACDAYFCLADHVDPSLDLLLGLCPCTGRLALHL